MERQPVLAGSKVPENPVAEKSTYDMVVFSHLRWEFVYQRPQHIISRLSRTKKILFIEEPIPFMEEEEDEYQLDLLHDNLHILKPKVKDIPAIAHVVLPLLGRESIVAGWFYSPAFVPLLGEFTFNLVVYDCMDELTLFKGASPHLLEQEKLLLSQANIVFTGGKSLYEAKSKYHPNVHCFPSSVDRNHFNVTGPEIPRPRDLQAISGPIIGYFGVIDERIDLELLRETALLQPNCSFVMLGPLAKIGEDDLPREKNIHYLGMKSYESLPHYLYYFDLAMMPFALNDATKFISPTKTLEYMAAGKLIISTPIIDVVRDYNHCIFIVETAQEFCEAIDKAWYTHKPDVWREYDKILLEKSWDSTVAAMESHLQKLAL